MRAQVRHAGQRVVRAVGRLAREGDYPVATADWLALCRAPQPLSGPQDWGLAVARIGSSGAPPGGGHTTRVGGLLEAFSARDDARAGLALAALAARFAVHLELALHYDFACTLPPDFRSGPDPAARLFDWPGVAFPLPVRGPVLAWRMAAGLGMPRADTGLWLAGAVAGARVLIVCARFERGVIEAAVHELHRGGARRVGVLALAVADDACDS